MFVGLYVWLSLWLMVPSLLVNDVLALPSRNDFDVAECSQIEMVVCNLWLPVLSREVQSNRRGLFSVRSLFS